jgi:hypothetical protein
LGRSSQKRQEKEYGKESLHVLIYGTLEKPYGLSILLRLNFD